MLFFSFQLLQRSISAVSLIGHGQLKELIEEYVNENNNQTVPFLQKT